MRAVGFYLTLVPGTSGGQAVSNSAPSPADGIRDFCSRNGHQLVEVFAAAEASEQESAFQRMTGSFRGPAGRPALVVVPDASHLAPDLETLAGRLLELRSAGADVRCADPLLPDIILNALERLSLRGVRDQRQARVRRAVLAKAARGEVLGRVPYGYAAGLDGILRPVPAQAEVVRRMFMLYAGERGQGAITTTVRAAPGQGDTAPGLRRIASRLNAEGLRTRKGLPWTPVAVAGILRNRAYAGVYSRYGTLIGGAHTPIVDRALFNAVQARLQARRPSPVSRSPTPFLFGGLVRCGVCGQGVFGLTRRRTWTLKDGSRRSRIYRYYECRERPHAQPVSPESPAHPSWRAERLEEAVLSVLGAGPGQPPAGTAVTEARAAARPGAPHGARAAFRRGKGGLALAEREFVSTLRQVAAGRARMSDLDTVLGALRAARTGAVRAPAAQETSAGPAAARTAGGAEESAVVASVERIILHADRVQVIRRPE
jgi:hypothetical protein